MGMFWKKQAETNMDTGSDTCQEHAFRDENLSSKACHSHLRELFDAQEEGAVMKLYIENFKQFNELFGYSYCENLLDQILVYLKKETNCPIYRYIGVEFIIILKNRTTGQCKRMAEDIAEKFAGGWKVGEIGCISSVQIGVCGFPGYATNADGLLKCLDLAVTKASEKGANQVVVYDTALHNQFLRRQMIAQNLTTAVTNHEIEVRYRPTYCTGTGRFTRAEFYMRIFIKELGMIGASEFVPIAEDSGQIRAVEFYALEKVAAMVRRLEEAGKQFESIALPISPVLLLQEDFLSEMQRVMETYRIPKGKLAIEIDESAMSVAYLNINILMQELNEMGIELILNNFGSAYSAISQICDLPVQTLKLDRLFVWQLETTPQAEPVIEGLIQIATKLGKNIIAEGVETQKQLNALNHFGCQLQQGFYYSPTLEEDILVDILDSSMEEAQAVLNREKEKMKQ